MKIFLAGSVSSATKGQLNKYGVYNKIISSCFPKANLITPNDIYDFRNNCIKEKPSFTKSEIDKQMVDFDLKQVRESNLVVCDISEQSCGLGLELGVCKENGVKVIFCFKNGSHVSNMIYGAFNDAAFIEYESLVDLETRLKAALHDLRI